MKRAVLALGFALFAVSTTLTAQTPTTATPDSSIAWDQPADKLATAQAATYPYYVDGATSAAGTLAASCVDDGRVQPPPPAFPVFSCGAPFPAFTSGTHTIALSAKDPVSLLETARSNVVTFLMQLQQLGTPTNARLLQRSKG